MVCNGHKNSRKSRLSALSVGSPNPVPLLNSTRQLLGGGVGLSIPGKGIARHGCGLSLPDVLCCASVPPVFHGRILATKKRLAALFLILAAILVW